MRIPRIGFHKLDDSNNDPDCNFSSWAISIVIHFSLMAFISFLETASNPFCIMSLKKFDP